MPNRNKSYSEIMPLRIKSLRISRSLTQKQLGDILFKAESTVRMWELGKSEPDSDTINQISQYFNVSTDYVLGRPFKLLYPIDTWHQSKRDDYEHASPEEQEYLQFKFGRGYFEEQPTAITDGEPVEEDVVIFHRDGKTQKKKLSKDQMAMLIAMVDALPESDDED